MFAFMARQRRELPDFDDLVNRRINIGLDIENKTEVTILRGLLFFYTDQKITLGELKEFYTSKAIAAFEADGYITIKK